MFSKLLFATLLFAPTLFAQGSTTYDVSVVHQSKAAAENTGIGIDDTTFQAENVPLKHLLDVAYDMRIDFIFGIPPALASKRYDVTAKVLDPDLPALKKFTAQQRRDMLIHVLEQRFALKAHLETRQLPIYELTALGASKLPPASPGHGVHNTLTTLDAGDIPMLQFCAILTNILHKTVTDKTGLPGRYAVHLKWSPDDNTDPANQDPPLLTALQEQLGLKLKPAHGPVQILVVDHIEPPTEN